MMPRLPGAVPEIPVSDVAAAAEYYRDKLGFTIDWIAADIELAGISRDDCRLFLAGPRFREERGNASPVIVWLNLSSKQEVDELFARWKETGAMIVQAAEDKPWNLREFRVADLDGNQLRVFYDFNWEMSDEHRLERHRKGRRGATE